MHTVVKVWGLPANNSKRDLSLAEGPIIHSMRDLGLSRVDFVIWLVVTAKSSFGKLILVEVEDLEINALYSKRPIQTEAGLLATELQSIWPGMTVVVRFNGATMVTRQ